MLSRVDLPQPEWPMMETYSPFSMPTVMSPSTSVACAPRSEGFVDVVDLEVGHAGGFSQLAAVPRVTMVAVSATSRSSTKPTPPM